MQTLTYLNGSVKNGNIMRWSINPLVVYIAPMKFYSKPGEDAKYRKMVTDALSAWSVASGGKVTFKITNSLYESNINVKFLIESFSSEAVTIKAPETDEVFSGSILIS